MEMLLMALCMSMFTLAVAAVAFGAATRSASSSSSAQPELRPVKTVAPGRFFPAQIMPPAAPRPDVPIEVLLTQIENHVRLEQAAAESFLECPSHAQLHTKTTSALVN